MRETYYEQKAKMNRLVGKFKGFCLLHPPQSQSAQQDVLFIKSDKTTRYLVEVWNAFTVLPE